MKSIVRATLWKAVLYGIMIAFAAHVGEAIPFPYHAGIAAWPVSAQTLLFFAGGFAVYTASDPASVTSRFARYLNFLPASGYWRGCRHIG